MGFVLAGCRFEGPDLTFSAAPGRTGRSRRFRTPWVRIPPPPPEKSKCLLSCGVRRCSQLCHAGPAWVSAGRLNAAAGVVHSPGIPPRGAGGVRERAASPQLAPDARAPHPMNFPSWTTGATSPWEGQLQPPSWPSRAPRRKQQSAGRRPVSTSESLIAGKPAARTLRWLVGRGSAGVPYALTESDDARSVAVVGPRHTRR